MIFPKIPTIQRLKPSAIEKSFAVWCTLQLSIKIPTIQRLKPSAIEKPFAVWCALQLSIKINIPTALAVGQKYMPEK